MDNLLCKECKNDRFWIGERVKSFIPGYIDNHFIQYKCKWCGEVNDFR